MSSTEKRVCMTGSQPLHCTTTGLTFSEYTAYSEQIA